MFAATGHAQRHTRLVVASRAIGGAQQRHVLPEFPTSAFSPIQLNLHYATAILADWSSTLY